MSGLARSYRTIVLILALIMSASPSMNSSASPIPMQRDGIPPVIISAVIDSQRRLEIVYRADDGLTYGGTVYLDTDPLNAPTPIKDTRRGDPMYCRTRWTCKTLGISAAPGVGQFTFLSKPLDPIQFPAGTWYVQVVTEDRDPDPSFRGRLSSNVAVVLLTAVVDPPTVSLVANGGVVGIGKNIPVQFTVTDKSKKAKVVVELYSGGELVQRLEDKNFVSAVGQKQSRKFSPIRPGANGPFYVCAWAIDEDGNLSAQAPKSACQWRSIEVSLSRVSNQCGAQGYGVVGDELANVMANTQVYGGVTVNFSRACDVHDAAYGGYTVYDPINKKLIDFRTMSRADIDLKFQKDIRKICIAALGIPKSRKQCTVGPIFSLSGTGTRAIGIIGVDPPGALAYWGGVRYGGAGAYDADATIPGVQPVEPTMTTPEGGARKNN